MTAPTDPPPVGRRALLTTLAAASAIAAIVFVGVVLPAEFDRDPTGLGKLTGLTALAKAKAAPPPVSADATALPARFYPTAFRADEIDIPLNTADAGKGGEELEYKVRMAKGATLVYALTVTGLDNPEEFYFDFHGERPGPSGPEVVEYLQATGLRSNGALVAPMDGIHGFFLQNSAAKPAVAHLRLSGFYTLVAPGQPGNEASIAPARSQLPR